MTSYTHWRLETDDQGFTWAWFDHADTSTNVLSSEALAEFGTIIEELHGDPPRGLVIASAKPTGFIAGADIKEFTRIKERA